VTIVHIKYIKVLHKHGMGVRAKENHRKSVRMAGIPAKTF
jgi:hypothetical protein